MKNLVKILYEYLVRDKVEFKFVKECNIGLLFGGIEMVVLEYSIAHKGFLKWPYINKKEAVYWKPFKNILSEEALPSLMENNKKGKDPYVNVWFTIKNKIQGNLYSVNIENKIKLNSSLNYILNFLFSKKIKN